jgi:hypothetical protein
MFYQRQYAHGYCTAEIRHGLLVVDYAYDRRPAWMKAEECPQTWGTHLLPSLENACGI